MFHLNHAFYHGNLPRANALKQLGNDNSFFGRSVTFVKDVALAYPIATLFSMNCAMLLLARKIAGVMTSLFNIFIPRKAAKVLSFTVCVIGVGAADYALVAGLGLSFANPLVPTAIVGGFVVALLALKIKNMLCKKPAYKLNNRYISQMPYRRNYSQTPYSQPTYTQSSFQPSFQPSFTQPNNIYDQGHFGSFNNQVTADQEPQPSKAVDQEAVPRENGQPILAIQQSLEDLKRLEAQQALEEEKRLAALSINKVNTTGVQFQPEPAELEESNDVEHQLSEGVENIHKALDKLNQKFWEIPDFTPENKA